MVDVFPVRSPTLPPATHTNCYRIGTTVFDPASPEPEEQERLWQWLGLGGRVERIVLTHHHGDHIGGVEDLVARSGAPVYAHRDARLPFPVALRLEEGDALDTGAGTLRCLHTPGHADGHLCFLVEGQGDILVGDMLAGVGTIVLVGEEGHLGNYLDGLARLARLGGVFHPAHGPSLPDGAAMAHAYIRHRHHRSDQIRAALRGGARSVHAVVEEVYAGVVGVDPLLAGAQVLTHLRWLADRGELSEQTQGWVST